jgi:anti-sigma B factor antagonist
METRLVDGVLIVDGDIDYHTVDGFRDRAQEAFPPGQPVVLDLAAVGFMDSTAIGALVHLRRRAGDAADVLTIVRPHRNVVSVLRVAGMSEYFTLR